jgi:hypothetical protein
MYVYVYVCMYVCMYVCFLLLVLVMKDVGLLLFMQSSIGRYVCMYVCMYVYVCVCMDLCIDVSMYVYMCVCLHVIYMYEDYEHSTQIHTYTPICIHTYIDQRRIRSTRRL